jgi:hypothetical protein
MADPLQTLRQRSVFGQGPSAVGSTPNPELPDLGARTFDPQVPNIGGVTPSRPVTPQAPKAPVDTGSDFQRNMDLYMPENRATDMFMDLMEHVPQRGQPGKLRSIAATMTALGQGGTDAGEKVLNAPFHREIGDFKLKADLLKDLAGAERAGNVNERMLLTSLLRQENQDANLAVRERAQAEKEKAGEATRELQRIRGRMAEIRESKTLGDAQKAALIAQYAQDLARLRGEIGSRQIGERGEIDLELEAARQAGDIETQRVIGEERRKTIGFEEGYKAVRGELPTQTKVRQYNIAREIYNSDPEARRFIKLGNPGTNDFQITPRNAWTNAGDEANLIKYDDYVRRIYAAAPAAAPPPPPGGAKPAPAVGGVDVYVRDPKTGKLVKK